MFVQGLQPVRISGRGGAALVIQPRTVFVHSDPWDLTRLGADLTLIDPARVVTYRDRILEPDFFGRLNGYLKEVTELDHSESLGAFSSAGAGLTLSIPVSNENEVDVTISITMDQSGSETEFDEMQFTSPRAALWCACQASGRIAEQIAGQTYPLLSDGE